MLNPAFSLFGSPVTHLEIVAALLSLACIACNVMRWHWAWPLTMVASALYGWLFFVSKLYADAALQLVFIGMAVWGWWQWGFVRDAAQAKLAISNLRRRYIPWLSVLWIAAWGVIGVFLKKLTDTDVPFWDAFPAAGGVIGTWLLAKKHIENWPVWLVVNAVAVTLFLYKKLYLTAGLYAVFFGMAVWGWQVWRAQLRRLP